MHALLKSNYLWIFYAIALTIFSFNLFLLWGIMVTVLFLLFFFFRMSGLERNLSSQERQSYLLAIFLYPLVETTLKALQVQGIISDDFTLINRLEHFCWAVALAFFFLPSIKDFWRSLNHWQNLILMLGFACLLGNLNEFLEYLLRVQRSLVDPVSFSRYYSDTILDMTMNLLGGSMGFVWLTRVLEKPLSLKNDGDR